MIQSCYRDSIPEEDDGVFHDMEVSLFYEWSEVRVLFHSMNIGRILKANARSGIQACSITLSSFAAFFPMT